MLQVLLARVDPDAICTTGEDVDAPLPRALRSPFTGHVVLYMLLLQVAGVDDVHLLRQVAGVDGIHLGPPLTRAGVPLVLLPSNATDLDPALTGGGAPILLLPRFVAVDAIHLGPPLTRAGMLSVLPRAAGIGLDPPAGIDLDPPLTQEGMVPLLLSRGDSTDPDPSLTKDDVLHVLLSRVLGDNDPGPTPERFF